MEKPLPNLTNDPATLYTLLRLQLAQSNPTKLNITLLLHILTTPHLPTHLLADPLPGGEWETLLTTLSKRGIVLGVVALLKRGVEGRSADLMAVEDVAGKLEHGSLRRDIGVCLREVMEAETRRRSGESYQISDVKLKRELRSALHKCNCMFKTQRKKIGGLEGLVGKPKNRPHDAMDVDPPSERRNEAPPATQPQTSHSLAPVRPRPPPSLNPTLSHLQGLLSKSSTPVPVPTPAPTIVQSLPPPILPVPHPLLAEPSTSTSTPATPGQSHTPAPPPPAVAGPEFPAHPPPYFMRVRKLPTGMGELTFKVYFQHGPQIYSSASKIKGFLRLRSNPLSFAPRNGGRSAFPSLLQPLHPNSFRIFGIDVGDLTALIRYEDEATARRALQTFQGSLVCRDGRCKPLVCSLE